MNIKILDSWLREYLKTKATPKQIAELLSLASVSVEKLERFGKDDWVYDVEVTTNRVDLMSVIALAREAAIVLSTEGIEAEFGELKLTEPKGKVSESAEIDIRINKDLVRRICAAVLEVDLKDSPQYIKDRLETSDIRSLNNIIDITNYVMREIGHPTHVFDYDKLATKRLEIREARPNEHIKTLDGKEYKLAGGDIVADDGLGHIMDLLGVMGLENSVVGSDTKKILYFIDTVEPTRIRKTSMSTGIRTEAAILNEKGIDPERARTALLRGIELYREIANGKIISRLIDIYPDKPKPKEVSVTIEKINAVIGVDIPAKQSVEILNKLGFVATQSGDTIAALVPSSRQSDIDIPEDLIEEIARIYGYHKIPIRLPGASSAEFYHQADDEFYWENRIKSALKYFGFSEVYTYSLIGEDLLEVAPRDAVKLKNPLTEDFVYLRTTLIPSLLKVLAFNKNREEIRVFELANVYHKKAKGLPDEKLKLGGVLKGPNSNFSTIKGVLEKLLEDLGISSTLFKPTTHGGAGTDIYIGKDYLGEIEVLEENIVDFELDFAILIKHASLSKSYTPVPSHPPVIEDVRIIIDPKILYEKIVKTIQKQSELITRVRLLDVYRDKKTFRITYQDPKRNLTNRDIEPIRKKVYTALENSLKAKIA